MKSKELLEENFAIGDSSMYANIFNELGIVLRMSGIKSNDSNLLDSSLIFFNISSKNDKSLHSLTKTANNIGRVNFQKGDINKAISNYFKAMKSCPKDNPKLLIPTLNNLGESCFYKMSFDSSEIFFTESLDLILSENSANQNILDKASLLDMYYTDELLFCLSYLDTLSDINGFTLEEKSPVLISQLNSNLKAQTLIENAESGRLIKKVLADYDRKQELKEIETRRIAIIQRLVVILIIVLVISYAIWFLVKKRTMNRKINNLLKEVEEYERS